MAPMSPFEELAASLENAQDWATLERILQNVEAAYQQAHILQTQAEFLALTAATRSQTMVPHEQVERLAA